MTTALHPFVRDFRAGHTLGQIATKHGILKGKIRDILIDEMDGQDYLTFARINRRRGGRFDWKSPVGRIAAGHDMRKGAVARLLTERVAGENLAGARGETT